MPQSRATSPASHEDGFDRLRRNPLATYSLKVIGLAILYIVTGKLGLLLSVPPGFATVIWPPSGLALGICLIHGRRFWPGIWLGSFLLNAYVAGGLDVSAGIVWGKLAVAGAIAAGSTIQILIACALARRFVGMPLKLVSVIQIFRLFILVGPVACVTAASIGVLSLRTAGLMTPAETINNWLSWWGGDVFGVIVFLPLALIAPGNPNPVRLNGNAVGRVSALALFLLLIPLGLTFYAWKIVSIGEFKAKEDAFTALSQESEKALGRRMDSYNNALVGASAFWKGKQKVSHKDWETYVAALNIKANYPGMNGIGVIEPATNSQLPAIRSRLASEGIQDFKVHPVLAGNDHFVITYLEPIEVNRAALGLDLAFEPNRLSAALQARDSGRTTLTKKIYLVQDREQTPGFMLIYPLFKSDQVPATVEGRRADLQGWIYSPFIAKNLLTDLTRSQGSQIDIEIFDQDSETPANLIYRSGDASSVGAFSTRRHFQVGQRTWLVVWRSTKSFDNAGRSVTPTLILSAGLLFTAMLAVLFFGVSLKDADIGDGRGTRERFIIPVTVFAVLMLGSIFAYRTLSVQEDRYADGLMERDASRIQELIGSRVEADIKSLERAAARWSAASRIPTEVSRADADNLVGDVKGLDALARFDGQRKAEWFEPETAGAGRMPGELADRMPAQGVFNLAVGRGLPTASPLQSQLNGPPQFTVLVPLSAQSQPLGYLAAFFNARTFSEGSLTEDVQSHYQISVEHSGRDIALAGADDVPLAGKKIVRTVKVANQVWTLQIRPTEPFLATQRSPFPIIALVAGLIIAVLCALTVQALLVLNRKSRELTQSGRRLFEASTLNAAVLASTKYIVVTTDPVGQVTSFNLEAEKALGYAAAEVVGRETPLLWHDAQEIRAQTEKLRAELGVAIEPGFEAFTARIGQQSEDTNEWTFIRRDGSRFPVSLTVTALRGEDGHIVGYLGVAEDITERRAQQQALVTSEETFRLAMENAPIGQALVGLDGRWLRVNSAVCELLGYSAEALLATDFQTITHPDDIEIGSTLVRTALSGENTRYDLEKRYIHKDGHIIWGLLSISLVRKADGTPDYFIAQIQDITERREMERMKSEFISTVSHELRTPLTSIRGSLDFVATTLSENLPDAGRRLVDMARRNCDRLVLLVNDILDIDKITSGTMRFDLRHEPVTQLVEQSVALNQAFAEKLSVGLITAPLAEKLHIRVDSARFQQAMTNLISNAAKFSPPGGTVYVAAALDGDPDDARVKISVRDEGPGVPANFRGRIFGRFAQADSSSTRAKGGSGLGLHITKDIVERMGGTIGYESAEGAGATFWMSFPAAEETV